jgi:hypothetical protein
LDALANILGDCRLGKGTGPVLPSLRALRFLVPRVKLVALSGLMLAAGGQLAMARTINLGDDSRGCISTSIVVREKPHAGSVCVARNSCARLVFAAFDAYPLRARHGHGPIHARVSHWLKPGDNDVFGWKGADATAAPECSVVETHY